MSHYQGQEEVTLSKWVHVKKTFKDINTDAYVFFRYYKGTLKPDLYDLNHLKIHKR